LAAGSKHYQARVLQLEDTIAQNHAFRKRPQASLGGFPVNSAG